MFPLAFAVKWFQDTWWKSYFLKNSRNQSIPAVLNEMMLCKKIWEMVIQVVVWSDWFYPDPPCLSFSPLDLLLPATPRLPRNDDCSDANSQEERETSEGGGEEGESTNWHRVWHHGYSVSFVFSAAVVSNMVMLILLKDRIHLTEIHILCSSYGLSETRQWERCCTTVCSNNTNI